MAVFWFGWAKKLKNIFTKQQADQYYLQKELPNQLQIVKGNVDFYKNVVVKQNGYVDRVDTNSNTAIPNKKYVDDAINQLKTKLRLSLIYDSGTSARFQNLDKIPVNLISNTQLDTTKPVYVSFIRYNPSNQSLGKYTGILTFFNYQTEQLVGTNLYHSRSTNNMEVGQYAGILFPLNKQAQVQCWDTTERIGSIQIVGYLL